MLKVSQRNFNANYNCPMVTIFRQKETRWSSRPNPTNKFVTTFCLDEELSRFDLDLFIWTYVRHGEIQGRYLVFYKAHDPVFYHV